MAVKKAKKRKKVLGSLHSRARPQKSLREQSVLKQRRNEALKQPTPKEGAPPLEGMFTSRGVLYSLVREDSQKGKRWFILSESQSVVVRDLPAIGLLAASSLMCAFHDAVAKVPPKFVIQPKDMGNPFAEDPTARLDRKITEQKAEISLLMAQRDEARRVIDVFAHAAVTRG